MAAVAGVPPDAVANGGHGRPGGSEDVPTRFEAFVTSGCTPCVSEAHLVATIPIAALKLPAFPRHAAGPSMRPGEIRVEAVRAHELGRPGRRSLALRMNLSVGLGAGGELYRLATGLIDEDQIPALVSAVTEMARLTGPPLGPGAESVDVSFHSGSLRIGVFRFAGETVAYLQAGDVHALSLRPLWEVGATIYMPPGQLSAVAAVIDQAGAKLKQLSTR